MGRALWKWNSHLDLEPLKENSADSLMISSMDAASFAGVPLLVKFISCAVKPLAFPHASSASSMVSIISSFFACFNSILSMERFPMMPVRKLLKSCAIPPASMVRDPNFSCFSRSFCIASKSVISFIVPIIASLPSCLIIFALKRTVRALPSFLSILDFSAFNEPCFFSFFTPLIIL